MDGNFETLKQAFATAGITIKDAGYSITPYSLNTPLSFKFNNLNELLHFLELSPDADTHKTEAINKMVLDAGLDANSFFYVNFFKEKIAEL
ncbi:hypothetical protein ACLI09_05165 [Flavobacterium sp. RHBU_24]|uniref:hypothetical protein n=1 Tax=Flavobacterium sp. RHBU_24 TaxID=3391185 RepID=UPI0039854501